jgi:cell division protein FtsQ
MSLFSNAGENRRLKRSGSKRASNLLEVSARPEKEGLKEIRRRLSWVLKTALGLISVGAVVVLGKTGAKRLFWENPAYAVADLRVSTDGMLTRAQVLELLGLEEGQNIFSVNVERMKATLDELPQVERAEVRRRLPDRVEIRIVERQPIAWVASTADAELGVHGQAYLVDARGYALKTRKVLPEYLSLPLIVGVNLEDIAPGQKLPTAEMLAAVELLRLSADEVRWMPRVVDVSKGYCLLVTDQRKARVTFGFENLEEQLNRLRQLLETVEPIQRDLQTVNLMLERNIPVTFAAPPVAPTSPTDTKAKGKAMPAPSKANPAAGAVNPLIVTADQIAKAQAAALAAAAAAAVAPPPSAPPKNDRPAGVLVTVSPSVPKPSKDTLGVMKEAAREVPSKDAATSKETAVLAKLDGVSSGSAGSAVVSEGPASTKTAGGAGVVSAEGSGSAAPALPNPRSIGSGNGPASASGISSGAPPSAGSSVGLTEAKRESAVTLGSSRSSGAPELAARKGAATKLSGGEVEKPREVSSQVSSQMTAPVVPKKAPAPAVVPVVSEAPVRAIPVKRSVPSGSASGGGSPAKQEPVKPEPSKSESQPAQPAQPSKPAPLIPNERLRKMFQPHA